MKKDYIIVNNLTHTYGDFVALNNIFGREVVLVIHKVPGDPQL